MIPTPAKRPDHVQPLWRKPQNTGRLPISRRVLQAEGTLRHTEGGSVQAVDTAVGVTVHHGAESILPQSCGSAWAQICPHSWSGWQCLTHSPGRDQQGSKRKQKPTTFGPCVTPTVALCRMVTLDAPSLNMLLVLTFFRGLYVSCGMSNLNNVGV